MIVVDNIIKYHELKQIKKIYDEGHAITTMKEELDALLEYSRNVPNRNYAWDLQKILNKYYTEESAAVDKTCREIVKYIKSERVTSRSREATCFRVF